MVHGKDREKIKEKRKKEKIMPGRKGEKLEQSEIQTFSERDTHACVFGS